MAWDTSTRAARLPLGWHNTRTRIFRRDHWTCQHDSCTYTNRTGRGLECDHVNAGDNHHDDNLQTLCAHHHRAKTINERPTKQPRQRPTEAHPGTIT